MKKKKKTSCGTSLREYFGPSGSLLCVKGRRHLGLLVWVLDKNEAQLAMEKLNCPSLQKLKCSNSQPNSYVNYFLLGLLFCFSLTLVIIGVVYIHQCEIADFIPTYLFILGLYGIVEQIIYFSNLYGDKSEYPTPSLWVLVRSFIIGLFVWGSVEFYNLGIPNFDSSKGPHCDKTLYLFTYWVNTIVWIAIVLIIAVTCMIILIFNCKSWLFNRNQVIQI